MHNRLTWSCTPAPFLRVFKHALRKGLVKCLCLFLQEIANFGKRYLVLNTFTGGDDSGAAFLSHTLVLLVRVFNLVASLKQSKKLGKKMNYVIDSFKGISKRPDNITEWGIEQDYNCCSQFPKCIFVSPGLVDSVTWKGGESKRRGWKITSLWLRKATPESLPLVKVLNTN